MKIIFSKYFEKRLNKLTSSTKNQFYVRPELFMINPHSEQLSNHPLHGEYNGYRSINISEDIRAVFKVEDEYVKFEDIGTHSQLYK